MTDDSTNRRTAPRFAFTALGRRLADLRIRSKLLAGFAVVLTTLLAAGLFGLGRLEDEMRTLISESSRSTARSILRQLEQNVYARLETLRELALTTPEIEAALHRSHLELTALGSEPDIRRLADERDAW